VLGPWLLQACRSRIGRARARSVGPACVVLEERGPGVCRIGGAWARRVSYWTSVGPACVVLEERAPGASPVSDTEGRRTRPLPQHGQRTTRIRGALAGPGWILFGSRRGGRAVTRTAAVIWAAAGMWRRARFCSGRRRAGLGSDVVAPVGSLSGPIRAGTARAAAARRDDLTRPRGRLRQDPALVVAPRARAPRPSDDGASTPPRSDGRAGGPLTVPCCRVSTWVCESIFY
jgi:hypothetical protein